MNGRPGSGPALRDEVDPKGPRTDDTEQSANVTVINESAAERLFPSQSAVGQTVLIAGGEWEVVGVVGDVRHQSLEQVSGLEFYLPLPQMGDWPTLEMVVRSSPPVESLVGGVRQALRGLDATMPTEDSQTLETRVVGRTMILAGVGVVVGAAASFVVSRSLASMLYGVEPTDPATFAGTAIVLLAVAGLAGFLPAARASRTDPVKPLESS